MGNTDHSETLILISGSDSVTGHTNGHATMLKLSSKC
jgi:hypothetical protein